MDFLQSALNDNAVFQGGFGLALLAGGAQFVRKFSTVGTLLFRRHFLVTMEVTSKDPSYPWVLSWITAQGGVRTQHLSCETSFSKTNSKVGSNVLFDLVPGPGYHLINYKGKFLSVERVREHQTNDFQTGKPWEKICFTAIGRDTSYFSSILNESFDLASLKEEGKTIIFTNWGGEWRQFGQPRSKRDFESVILDEGVSEYIYNDVLEWCSSAKWYFDRGIPYRRGYLLQGPPGSGKSSFIMALAGKLNYNVCVLNLAERGLTDDRLNLALSVVPPKCIVLLEDVDAAFPSREQNNLGSDITFSGLLNCLDGASSSEDRLIFMTTNHIERLDPALIRPGRVDIVSRIDNASEYQIRKLFKKFYPTSKNELIDEFVHSVIVGERLIFDDQLEDKSSSSTSEIKITEKNLAKMKQQIGTFSTPSMAVLQGHFLKFKNNPEGAVKEVNSIFNNDNRKTNIKPQDATVNNTLFRERRARRGKLSADQIDGLHFNPQDGWEKL